MESFLHYLISHKAFLTTEKLITVNVTFCSNVGYLFPLAWKSALVCPNYSIICNVMYP